MAKSKLQTTNYKLETLLLSQQVPLQPFQFCFGQPGIGELQDQLCRFLELSVKGKALASQFISRTYTKQCRSNGKNTLSSLRKLQTDDRGRYRSVGNLMQSFANGIERISADDSGDCGKAADRNE